MNQSTPTPPAPARAAVFTRLFALLALVLTLLETSLFALQEGYFRGPLAPLGARVRAPIVTQYLPLRTWVLTHPAWALTIGLVSCLLVLLLLRTLLLFWHNEIVARLTGNKFRPDVLTFPMVKIDLLAEIVRRPPGHCFVGLSPTHRFGLRRWKPVYISPRQRSMHRHVMGKTGSGKTLSVLWPQVLQDALDGKGVLVMDAKGSDENIRAMKAIAAMTGRQAQLRVFALPAWNQPRLASHTYNMVYVRPRTPSDPGGDPAVTAERVFSVLPLGDNEYYNTQAQVMFTNLCKLLHGMVDEQGNGIPFTLQDIAVCFRGIGITRGWVRPIDYCLKNSTDRRAALAIRAQIEQLKDDVTQCFSGIIGALERFLSPIVNAYDPDIIIEDVLQQNLLVYVQLPANLFKIQAPALGRVILQDVQQEASLRQVFRQTKNQRPFGVVVDEFYNFADISIIDSLNKLRDAHLEYTLAHQSLADLELVSKEFGTAVWDNTRTKDILAQDNPELCEKVARSIGTHQTVLKTVRLEQGALFTSLITGDASSRLVEEYRLHPNRIKGLARAGQGYFFNDEGLHPVCYGMLPPLEANYPLPQRDQSKARGLRLYERFVAKSERNRRA